MFKYDTFNPMRILEAVKGFVLGLGERGEVAVVDPAAVAPVVNDWKSGLPEDVKADPIWEKFKEPADAFRSLVGAQKFLGREKLPVPVDENDKETYGMIFKRLGLPETPDKYTLPTDLDIPKDFPIDENMLVDFKKVAHESGLLPKQVAGLYSWFMKNQINAYGKMGEAKESAMKEAETSLRSKWGAAYQQNVTLAQKVMHSFADQKAIAEIDKGIGNNPVLVEMFANIGKAMSEDQLTGKPASLTLTPLEAQQKIDLIKQDMNHAYWKSENPAHDAAVAEIERLTKLAMAGQQ